MKYELRSGTSSQQISKLFALWWLAVASFILCAPSTGAYAQPEQTQVVTPAAPDRVTNPPPSSQQQGATTSDDAPKAYVTYKTPYEFFLAGGTVALGTIMALMLCIMCWRTGVTEEFIRSFIVLVVVFAACFLIVAGYSEKQTAPVFGLLGTIVGYIFGRAPSASTAEERAARAREV